VVSPNANHPAPDLAFFFFRWLDPVLRNVCGPA
jgi:hypothetical protein